MSIYSILLALEVIGLLIAGYLVHKRKKNEHVVCLIGEDCQAVLESKYNTVFGVVHNDVMGLLYYIVMIILLNFLKFEVGPAEWWLIAVQALAIIGGIMAVMFMFIQWRVLKAWCFWCILSNIDTWIIALIILKYL